MKRTLCALFIMSAIAVSVLSAGSSIDGLWVGDMQTDAGSQTIQMSILTPDGSRIGGSLSTPSQEFGMRNVSLDGNVLEFDTFVRTDANTTKFHWTGIVNGDEIMLSNKTDDQQTTPVQFVVHRQAQ